MELFSSHSYEERHERLNTLSHLLGTFIFAVGSIFLLWQCRVYKQALLLPVSFYAGTLVGMFLVSSIYHATRKPDLKHIWRVVDHCFIFLFMGATYALIVNRYLHSEVSSWFLNAMWVLISIGMLMKIFFTGKFPLLETAVYLALGWMGMLIIQPVMDRVPIDIISLIAIGGIFYTIGIFFFQNETIAYNHTIWHLFVLGGAIVHFGAVLQLVMA